MTLIGSTLQWLASVPQGTSALVQHPPTTSIILQRWHTAAAHAALLPDPWAALRIEAFVAAERAIRRRWVAGAWSADVIIVKVERDAFAHGAMRTCHRMKLRVGSHLGWRSSSCVTHLVSIPLPGMLAWNAASPYIHAASTDGLHCLSRIACLLSCPRGARPNESPAVTAGATLSPSATATRSSLSPSLRQTYACRWQPRRGLTATMPSACRSQSTLSNAGCATCPREPTSPLPPSLTSRAVSQSTAATPGSSRMRVSLPNSLLVDHRTLFLLH